MSAIVGSIREPTAPFIEFVAWLQAGAELLGPTTALRAMDIAERATAPTGHQAAMLRQLRGRLHAADRAPVAVARPPVDSARTAAYFGAVVQWISAGLPLLGAGGIARLLIAMQPGLTATLSGPQAAILKHLRRGLMAAANGDVGRAAAEDARIGDLYALLRLDEEIEAGR